jgi:alanine dehydrogenase
MLILSEKDIRSLVTMDDLIETMHDALVEFSTGRVRQPLRTVLDVGHHAFFGVMPAFIPKNGALATKLVTVFASNLEIGLPSHLATIVLLDSTTGELLSLMDGRYITEARTAAVSAVSTRLLAREDAGTLAIFGSGVQRGVTCGPFRASGRSARCASGVRTHATATPSATRCSRKRQQRSPPRRLRKTR